MDPIGRSFRDSSDQDGAGGARLRVVSGLQRFLQASRPGFLSRSGHSVSRVRRLRGVTRTDLPLENGLGRSVMAHCLTWDFFFPGELPEGLQEEELILLN